MPCMVQPRGFTAVGVADPEAAVLGLELIGDLVEEVDGLAEHLGGVGDGEDDAWRGHGQAASAAGLAWAAFQFQGSSSCRREAG